MNPLGAGPLVICAIAGLVVGWGVHSASARLGFAAPVVSWGQGVILLVGAAILAGAARATTRAVRSGVPLDSQRAVNRLVLARACALVGALTAGGYSGYAISWLGHGSEVVGTRIATTAFAALGAVGLLIAAKLLELACRVPYDPEES